MDQSKGTTPPGGTPGLVRIPRWSLRKGVLLLAIVAAFAILLVVGPTWPRGYWLRETVLWAGIALIVICILGRTWTSLYIGGRKNRTLTTHGPYSISRNPLYVFSILGGAGIGALVGSITTMLACGLLTWAVFLWTTRREETTLAQMFGDPYRRYCERVPRFFPKPWLWRDLEIIEVRPPTVMLTFVDALVFLIPIPLLVAVDHMHRLGTLPVLIQLP